VTKPIYTLDNVDAILYLQGIQDRSIDLIITDIPYESLEKYRAVGTTTRLKHSDSSSNDWFNIFQNDRIPSLFREMYRVLNNGSHCYMFSDEPTMFVMKPIGEECGFKYWKGIVWDTLVIGMGYHYRSRHEFILFFEKGKRKLADLSVPDVLQFRRICTKDKYPTEKPVDLIEVLVKQSSCVGDIVMDPFCGSGSTGEAAMINGRNFMGNDIAEEAVTRSRNRFDASQSYHSY
jgi:site-specific DNA-methyltransferase (adenine-specific)